MHAAAAVKVKIGALGQRCFRAGHLAYVGSAMGPGGLASRLRRHLAVEKTRRWHLDYLRPHVDVRAIWYLTSPEHREVAWVRLLEELPGVSPAVDGFGASDSPCRSHLLAFVDEPMLTVFQAACATRFPDDPALESWTATPRE